jgi:hypothetical protein
MGDLAVHLGVAMIGIAVLAAVIVLIRRGP